MVEKPVSPKFQLTAARRRLDGNLLCSSVSRFVSTHSRPKAAGRSIHTKSRQKMFQLTAARRRLGRWCRPCMPKTLFQLTAARRRLGWCGKLRESCLKRFNSQPPEGGWFSQVFTVLEIGVFQLTAARRRLDACNQPEAAELVFQLTAARRRLAWAIAAPAALLWFQLTAARRRLVKPRWVSISVLPFQLTAARRRLARSVFGALVP